jgi:hypothetical protein
LSSNTTSSISFATVNFAASSALLCYTSATAAASTASFAFYFLSSSLFNSFALALLSVAFEAFCKSWTHRAVALLAATEKGVTSPALFCTAVPSPLPPSQKLETPNYCQQLPYVSPLIQAKGVFLLIFQCNQIMVVSACIV